MTPSRPIDTRALRVTTRRQWLAHAADVVCLTVPIVGLGYWATLLGRSTEPRTSVGRRMLLGPADAVARNAVSEIRTPNGETVRVHAPLGAGEPWLALRDTCPHLGCRLTFDAGRSEYVCPCHRGRFDVRGAPLEGPPRAAGLSMLRAEVLLDGGLVFVVVPGVAASEVHTSFDPPQGAPVVAAGRGRP